MYRKCPKGWFITGHQGSIVYESKDLKKKKKMRCLNIFSDTETDDFGEVGLMKEEQKKKT